MKKYIKLLLISIIFVCTVFANTVFAASIKVTSWDTLKSTIDNNNSSTIDIELSDSVSSNWNANSKILILEGKTVNISSTSSITLKKNTITGSLFHVKGSLNINSSSNKYITLDGSKDSIQSSNALINVEGGNISLTNVILQNNNRTSGFGGAISVSDASSTICINNSTIQNNTATYGGGIYIGGKNVKTTLTNTKVLNNTASNGSGGGIYAYGTLTINGNNSSISSNKAQTYGGGIMAKQELVINSGTISNNDSVTEAGGGIKSDGKTTLVNGTITSNKAYTTGGGIDYAQGSFIQKGGTIKNNTALKNGVTNTNITEDIYPDSNYVKDWINDKNYKLEKFNVSLMKSYIKGTDVDSYNTQGMTITDKYIVFAQIITTEKTRLYIADKNTYKILKKVDLDKNLDHANDMAYNSKTNEVLIVGPNEKIGKFKINDKQEIPDFSYVTSVRRYGAIAYDSDHNQYIGYRGKKIYITDSNFKELSSFSISTNLTIQGLGYYNNQIYLSTYECGNNKYYQTYFSLNEKGSNLVMVYNMDGTLDKSLYISNKNVNGEIESVAFIDNTLIASYNIKLNDKSTISFFKGTINKQQSVVEPTPTTKDSESRLSQLNIEGYNIGFDSNKYEYTLELNPSVTSINITALAMSDKASISGIGIIDLTKTNKVNISVKAENGDTKNYVINIVFKDDIQTTVPITEQPVETTTTSSDEPVKEERVELDNNSKDTIFIISGIAIVLVIIISILLLNIKKSKKKIPPQGGLVTINKKYLDDLYKDNK